MILRMWHGYTAPQNADAYYSMLQEMILPGLHRVSGYRGAYVARRHVENEVEFMTLTLWDSKAAVHAFSTDGRAVIHKEAVPPAHSLRRILDSLRWNVCPLGKYSEVVSHSVDFSPCRSTLY